MPTHFRPFRRLGNTSFVLPPSTTVGRPSSRPHRLDVEIRTDRARNGELSDRTRPSCKSLQVDIRRPPPRSRNRMSLYRPAPRYRQPRPRHRRQSETTRPKHTYASARGERHPRPQSASRTWAEYRVYRIPSTRSRRVVSLSTPLSGGVCFGIIPLPPRTLLLARELLLTLLPRARRDPQCPCIFSTSRTRIAPAKAPVLTEVNRIFSYQTGLR